MDKKKINNSILLSLNLIDYKNHQKYIKTLYAISNNIHNHYRKLIIKKSNGKIRTIYEPSKILKHIQRSILHHVLEKESVSVYAKAYVKGLSLKDNAISHINKPVVLKLDIKNFFDNISFYDVYSKCFNEDKFPRSVGMLLAHLCTYDDFLPQGAPTSSYIANLVMKDFDMEIGILCQKQKISYTRYSDDLTFSGDLVPSDIINVVRKKLYKLGLEINNKKIHIIRDYQRQVVTGVIVNDKMQVSKNYRDKIRQEIYYINKYGLKSHLERINVHKESEYLNKLYGRILFVLQINNNDKEFLKYKELVNEFICAKI